MKEPREQATGTKQGSDSVPQDFLAAVAEAEKNGWPGDLALLAEEVQHAPWALPALRAVGRAQFALRALEAARETWERVQRLDADDVEANTLLAATHQQLDLGAPHVLLFTGHRIDEPGRPRPRFPPTREAVDTARREIGKAIDEVLARHGPHLVGMSGAASGGDILFQQECRSRGIATTIFLALPRKKYAAASVSSAGPRWTRDFHDLLANTPSRELQQSNDLPPWLAHRENYSIWQRSNLWMLHNALAHGHHRVTLLALWDGQKGDGAGGTEDMVRQITSRGGEVIAIGKGTLFRSRGPAAPS